MHLFQQSLALGVWILINATQDKRWRGNPMWLVCAVLLDNLQPFSSTVVAQTKLSNI
jgi:hypothetical protein